MQTKMPKAYLVKTNLTSIGGTPERVWDRALLLDFLNDPSCKDFVILGGDVVELTDGQMRYTYDNWALEERKIDEPFPSYCERSRAVARAYISRYPDLPHLYFLPVLDSEITAGL